MGFLDDIKAKIFGAPQPQVAVASAPDLSDQQQAAVTAGMDAANKVIADALAQKAAAAAQDHAVDVAAVLDAAVAASGQQLNWKTSIVDLLKALNLDSSLTARKTLADELGYTGDKSDSATMNVWLHKQVLAQLAANGGKVPETLLA